jgi:hypothetical protein
MIVTMAIGGNENRWLMNSAGTSWAQTLRAYGSHTGRNTAEVSVSTESE